MLCVRHGDMKGSSEHKNGAKSGDFQHFLSDIVVVLMIFPENSIIKP